MYLMEYGYFVWIEAGQKVVAEQKVEEEAEEEPRQNTFDTQVYMYTIRNRSEISF